MSQGNPRRERVAQAMREILAEMLDREIKDPRVREAGLASIHHVELNRDMSVARVSVSFLGPAETDARLRARALAGLEASAGFLRGPVGRRMRLRHAPELRFVLDDSTAFQQRITELVRGEESAQDKGDDSEE
jgi:ribosome-binding factor A